MYGWILLFPTYQVRSGRHPVQFGSFFDPLRRLDSLFFFFFFQHTRSWSTFVEYIRVCCRRRGYLPPLRWTTMVPATMSYTVLLCWKKRRVMKTGKRKAMEKFLLSARTVELGKTKGTKQNRGWIKSCHIDTRLIEVCFLRYRSINTNPTYQFWIFRTVFILISYIIIHPYQPLLHPLFRLQSKVNYVVLYFPYGINYVIKYHYLSRYCLKVRNFSIVTTLVSTHTKVIPSQS